MPDISPRLGLKLPKGTETVNRAAYRENLETIDQTAARRADLETALDGAAGHRHTGVPGDAPPIGAQGLAAGAATDTVIGERTVNPALPNPANTGPITSLLSWIVGRLAAITGLADWKAAPPTTLQAADNHIKAAVGAHPAAAISYAGGPGMTATNVESAIDELAAGLQAITPDQIGAVAAGTPGLRARVTAGVMEYSVDGVNWSPAGTPAHLDPVARLIRG